MVYLHSNRTLTNAASLWKPARIRKHLVQTHGLLVVTTANKAKQKHGAFMTHDCGGSHGNRYRKQCYKHWRKESVNFPSISKEVRVSICSCMGRRQHDWEILRDIRTRVETSLISDIDKWRALPSRWWCCGDGMLEKQGNLQVSEVDKWISQRYDIPLSKCVRSWRGKGWRYSWEACPHWELKVGYK